MKEQNPQKGTLQQAKKEYKPLAIGIILISEILCWGTNSVSIIE